jgi:hypothetical protein
VKTAKENIIEVLGGKKMIFLENGGELDNGLDRLQEFMATNGLENTVLLYLQKLELDNIIQQINQHDGIIFQTQWVYKISKDLKEYMFSLKAKKIVVECCICDPTWYYKPEGIAHDLYIVKPSEEWEEKHGREWEFYEITDKPYWDYKNKFNK